MPRGRKVVQFTEPQIHVPINDAEQRIKARELADVVEEIDKIRADMNAENSVTRKKIRSLISRQRVLAECVLSGTKMESAQMSFESKAKPASSAPPPAEDAPPEAASAAAELADDDVALEGMWDATDVGGTSAPPLEAAPDAKPIPALTGDYATGFDDDVAEAHAAETVAPKNGKRSRKSKNANA